MRRLLLVACLSVFVGGCGDKANAPTTPTPTVVAPSITTSGDIIYMGQTVQMAATGTDIRWGGDNPAVANVDAMTGRVTGTGTGRVTVWAENIGGRATRLLRGMPSFAGEWGGNYQVTECHAIGSFFSAPSLGFCASLRPGTILNMGLSMSQNGERVTGHYALGTLTGNLDSGVVGENGVLPLTSQPAVNGLASVRIENMRLESTQPGIITGRMELVFSQVGQPGHGRVVAELRNLTRSSSVTVSALTPAEPLAAGAEGLIRAVTRP
jgi:hypothetical protein